ncbi:hypothetical protein G7B40_031035 [Aetokthonos hydrillicola Thurmond2011]|uniref:Uncharacterized protein n=1 Tax=Aetokthonos hydrillicola Thurmond2011 TaxID=2712845 RepID=A0AAP5ICB4_9CYAN|nr:hypothetical protein [Aetokthonos hydrillicola]MDR9898960.1 hypothetical protein [Aetokthonos hydrillicola Thurmond2011]
MKSDRPLSRMSDRTQFTQKYQREFRLRQDAARRVLFGTKESSLHIYGHQKGFCIPVEDGCS